MNNSEKTWEELLKVTPNWFTEKELSLVYDLITLLIKMKKLEHDASFSQDLYNKDEVFRDESL